VAQGSGACNGWTFWHIETKKGLRLIDELHGALGDYLTTCQSMMSACWPLA